MQCKKAQILIADYSVGLISGKTKKEFEEHIAKCAICSAEMRKLESAMRLVDELPQIEPPVGLWNGVYNRITAQNPAPVKRSLSKIIHTRAAKWYFGTAAAALLIAAAFTGLNTISNEPAPSIQGHGHFLREHLIYTSTDLLSDPASTNLKAIVLEDDDSGNGVCFQ